jgi:hypothetical protein
MRAGTCDSEQAKKNRARNLSYALNVYQSKLALFDPCTYSRSNGVFQSSAGG